MGGRRTPKHGCFVCGTLDMCYLLIMVTKRYRPREVSFLLLLFFGQAKKRQRDVASNGRAEVFDDLSQ